MPENLRENPTMTKVKRFFKTVWYYAFPLRHIFEWYREFTHIRHTNGRTYYERSGSKAIRSAVGFAAVGILLVLLFGAVIIVGIPELILAKKGNLALFKHFIVIRKSLTPAMFSSLLGLGAILAAAFGFLQSNYTKHKEAAIKNFTVPTEEQR